MSRPLRIEYENAWYHVMNRGAGGQKIFLDNHDRRFFLDLLKEICETWNIQTHAFSLMSNHYHLSICTPNKGLSRSMRHLNGVYTQRFNRRHKTDGSLFRGRFKSRLVEQDTYLLELARYIHLNPVKAGLCGKPEEYEWSSHKEYLNLKKPTWLFIDTTLSYFGKYRRPAARKFASFVREKLKDDDWYESLSFKKQPLVLGSDKFKEWVKDKFIKKRDATKDQEIPEVKQWMRPHIELAKIIEIVSKENGFSKVDNMLAEESRVAQDARSMAVYLTRKLTGASHEEIANELANIQKSAIAQQIYRFKRRLNNDQELNKRREKLEKFLLSIVKT